MIANQYLMQVRLAILIMLVLFLASCATGKKPIATRSADEIWQERQQELSRLDRWQIKGRIGFASAKDSGSASLYWKQSNKAYELKIVAPLGAGSLIIVGDKNGVILQSSEGEMIYADDAQSLIWQRTGWVIPMGSLRRWILGLPSQEEDYKLDDKGRVHSLNNRSWAVEYLSYQRIDQHELPRKLRIHSPDAQIKLVIKDWQLLPGN